MTNSNSNTVNSTKAQHAVFTDPDVISAQQRFNAACLDILQEGITSDRRENALSIHLQMVQAAGRVIARVLEEFAMEETMQPDENDAT